MSKIKEETNSISPLIPLENMSKTNKFFEKASLDTNPMSHIQNGYYNHGELTGDVKSINEDAVEITQVITVGENHKEDLDDLEDLVEKLIVEVDNSPAKVMSTEVANLIRKRLVAIERAYGTDTTSNVSLLSNENHSYDAFYRTKYTSLAVEDVKETIKDMWIEIKSFLLKLWEKIKLFWKTHIATIARLEGALDSVGTRVRGAKGNPTLSAEIRAPAGFQRLFSTGDDKIGSDDIGYFLKRQTEATLAGIEYTTFSKDLFKAMSGNTDMEQVNDEVSKAVVEGLKENPSPIEFGNSDEPLVNQVFFSVDTSVDEKGSLIIAFESNKNEYEYKKDLLMAPGDKAQLEKNIMVAKLLLKNTKELGKSFEEINDEFETTLKRIASLTNRADIEKAQLQGSKRIVSSFRSLCSNIGKINTKLVSLNASCIKGVIYHTNKSLGTYTR